MSWISSIPLNTSLFLSDSLGGLRQVSYSDRKKFILVNIVDPMQNFICLNHVPALSLLSSKVGRPSFRNLSVYAKFLHDETSFYARFWTFSMIILSFLYRGEGQIGVENSNGDGSGFYV